MDAGILFVDCELSEQQKVAVSRSVGLTQTSSERPDLSRRIMVRPPRVVVIGGDHDPGQLFADIKNTRALSEVPLLVLVDDSATAISALRLGADSAASAPGNPEELELKISLLLRRVEAAGRPSRYEDSQIQIDREEHRVHVGAAEIDLTPTEHRLLSALLDRPGVVVSHDELLEKVWSRPFHDRSEVKLYVSYVRRKLQSAGIDPIETVRGVGYRYRPPGDDGPPEPRANRPSV
jgi:DNA-binding response OmpR family regulator